MRQKYLIERKYRISLKKAYEKKKRGGGGY